MPAMSQSFRYRRKMSTPPRWHERTFNPRDRNQSSRLDHATLAR
jgi:hypothetical protein